ncbi:MAG: NAD-dependent epimerase/dehydratase family protein [Chloroflexota bacterium]|nr:NAD-dependent epimerase/dehydratase family protein [Chloroflexota bacterium]
MTERILILGGDGYLGWPTAMHFSQRGARVAVLDNGSKRAWERELGVEPLVAIPSLDERVRIWQEISGRSMELFEGDLTDADFVHATLESLRPDTIVHYGEQPSAPYSMIDVRHATFTQTNNIVGTLNLLFAMRDLTPDSHLVKLGTMGEYGTPDIDIEEGYLTVDHNGRSHTFLYPKTPGSMYHLSKVHDSHNMHFACRVWGLRATDLNQGVVYGLETEETVLDPRLVTSFHYDEVFGTALNRFCVQAVAGEPVTVYGGGGQTRGYLNIRDTLACVALAVDNPAERGKMRVFNQFTETFTVLELAERVREAAAQLGIAATVVHAENPRFEAEEHYYNPKRSGLVALGLEPHLLTQELIDTMLQRIVDHRARIRPGSLVMNVLWTPQPATGPTAGS